MNRCLLTLVLLVGLSRNSDLGSAQALAQQTVPAARTLYFAIDDLHLAFRDTIRIRALFRKIAPDIVHEGDRFAVFFTASPTTQLDVTTDRSRLNDAAMRMTGAGLRPSQFIEGFERDEIVHRAHVALSRIGELLTMAGDDSNQKVVLLLSEGWDFDAAHADLTQELNTVISAANRVNARVYTLDPSRVVSPVSLVGGDPAALAPHRLRMEITLRTLSGRTGGVYAETISDLQGASQ